MNALQYGKTTLPYFRIITRNFLDVPICRIFTGFNRLFLLLSAGFQTTPMEMEAVANIFDRNGDGFVDYKEFVAALRPDTNVSFRFTLAQFEQYYTPEFVVVYTLIVALNDCKCMFLYYFPC